MDLFTLGTPVIDLFAKVGGKTIRELPITKGATNYFGPQELAKIERLLSKKISYRYPGDNARNVCEGFASLGGFAGFQGAVGDDDDAALFESNLSQCGIAPFLQEKKGRTGKIIALVTPDRQRTFCADLGVSWECDRFEKYAVSESKMLYVSSITLSQDHKVARLAERYLEAFRKMGRRVAISLENPPLVASHKKRLSGLVKKYADVLFMNEDEAEAFLGASYEKKLLSLKPKIPVYLKLGKKGSKLFMNGKSHKILPINGRVVDTTGAGDAYAAGTLYGLSRGYSPMGSGRLGCMLATKVISKFGAGIPLAHTRIRIRHEKVC